MTRFAYFEVRTPCRSCGQPVPFNGPFDALSCCHCAQAQVESKDAIGGIVRNFEQEYSALGEGGGKDRQYVGSASCHMRRIGPHCLGCSAPLPQLPLDFDGESHCPQCGKSVFVYPAPPWLVEACPTAAQVIASERPHPDRDGSTVEIDAQAVHPVLMACPGCGAGLSLTSDAARVHRCQYCLADVFIPDALWQRVHPVKALKGWWLRYEGAPQTPRVEPPAAWQDEGSDDGSADTNDSVPPWGKRRGIKLPSLDASTLLAVGFGLIALVFVVIKSSSESHEISGQLVGSGPDVGTFTLAPERCYTGAREGFAGVYLAADELAEPFLKVIKDPQEGEVAVLRVPRGCEGPRCSSLTLSGDNCDEFSAKVARANRMTQRMWVYNAYLTLDCTLNSGSRVRGSVTLEYCD